MKSREIPREHQFVATCMLTANLAQCTDRAAIRPASGRTVRFFKALSGVQRSIKPDAYLSSFLRQPRRSQVRPPGHRSAVFYYCAHPPPPGGRRSVVFYYCVHPPPPGGRRSVVCYYCAQPTPPPPVVGPWCVTTARYHYFFHKLN